METWLRPSEKIMGTTNEQQLWNCGAFEFRISSSSYYVRYITSVQKCTSRERTRNPDHS